jgi:hypothetical protein
VDTSTGPDDTISRRDAAVESRQFTFVGSGVAIRPRRVAIAFGLVSLTGCGPTILRSLSPVRRSLMPSHLRSPQRVRRDPAAYRHH